ncbi:hypothetical protein Acr_04g0001070 [Actinidia rufa]|uniref:Uncharacterized protein n=1 Tax=Actinidia rufa TaxID=165716 RepID=A0A7J0EHI7_9ERIC|nr:hypothetical protein Acr_04g0001070 [Actinidia rufa]
MNHSKGMVLKIVQLLLGKRKEPQRQQHNQQLEAIRQNSLYQIPSITNQASVSHSTVLINGTPVSPITEASNYPWATETTASNTTWLQRATPAIQVDQSPYGVPISNTRGTHQYSRVPQDKPPMWKMSVSSNFFPGNQFTGFPDQVHMHDGSVVSRQVIQGANLFGHDSGQCFDNGMNLENLPQVNALQRNASLEEFHERQELVGPSVTMQERTGMQVSSSQNAVSLDPTEEKILFGDDNIWDAFGSSVNMGAEETTSNDIGLQEEWSGPSSQKTEVAPVNRQLSSYQGVPGFQQSGQKSLYEHGEKLQMDSTYRSMPQSSEEGSKWLSRGPLQKPLAERSQIYGDTHSLDVEMTAKSTLGFCAHQQIVVNPQNRPNDCNVGETVALGQDAVLKTRENENKFQHLPEKMSHGGHVCKAKVGPYSTMGLEHGMSLMGSSQETSQLLPSKHHFNQWKRADSSMKSKGRDDSRKTHETENNDGKENSSDSHSSNLSQRTATCGASENVWSDGNDTWYLPGMAREPLLLENFSTIHWEIWIRLLNLMERNMVRINKSCPSRMVKHHIVTIRGYMLDHQGNEKEVADAPPRGTPPRFTTNTSAPFDRSVSIYEPNKATQSSQNMLKLLHKMDQSLENQSSASQSFSLQLAPPSQRLPIQNHVLASLSSAQTVGSLSSFQTTHEIREKIIHRWLPQPMHNLCLFPLKYLKENSSLVELACQAKLATKPHSMTGDCISIACTDQSTPASLSDIVGSIPHDKSVSSEDISEPIDINCSGKRVSVPLALAVQAMPFSQPFVSSGISQEGAFPKMVRNAWTNVSGQHHLFGAQPHKFPSNDHNAQKRCNGPSEISVNFRDSQGFVSGEGQPAKESLHQLVSSCNTELAGNMTASQGKESLLKNLSDASPSNSSSTQRDIEAFGRSLTK